MTRLLRAAALVLLTVASVVPAAVAAAPPVPEHDPFYAVPAGIGDLPNGTVLASRKITAYSGPVAMPARSWQVKFKTLDNQGAATATVTTVMIPTAPWAGAGPRPLVSYQVAEDGVGGKCSASYALRTGIQPGGQAGTGNAQDETFEIRQALEQGWAVSAPDYEGPRSAFLGADIEARETLDAVRAALGFKPAGLGARAPVALWGYSGGALASSLAAQEQPGYAPDLRLSGIALGGVVADLRATFQAFDAIRAGAAGVVIGAIGLGRAHPSIDVARYFNAAGRRALAASQTDCLGDAIAKYGGRKASAFAASPDSFRSAEFAAVLRDSSPLGRPGIPAAPVYDYHSAQDELAPIGPDRELMTRYCAASVPVQHVEFPGEHFSGVAAGLPGVLQFLAARFAGRPPVSTC